MMIDSDIIPPLNILNLVDFQKDIITPLMFVQQKEMIIPLFLKRYKDGTYNADDYLNKSGLQETDATGTGCIILSRKVLETINHPFENVYDVDGIKTLGNDFNFCRKAKKEGFGIWVHLDYICSHITQSDLKDQFYEALGKFKAERELAILTSKLKEKSPNLFETIMKEVKSETLTLKIGEQTNEN
jgi:GT2 family glycosyltransferase